MRYLILGCAFIAACAGKAPPAQDPLDYLQVGVDPRAEANAIIGDLRQNGFQVGRRIDEAGYVAFDAAAGGDATVRIVTSRGVALSVGTPDARWPERLWVELASEPRPDFDRDGQRDVLVSLRERDRTCLGWVEVNPEGFASEVFRPMAEWGESPCVLEIDPDRPRLLLEVSLPGMSDARVRVPVKGQARTWVLDDSVAAQPHWRNEITRRRQALEVSEKQGQIVRAARLRAEIAWLEQLRNAGAPVLEPADDGEEAR